MDLDSQDPFGFTMRDEIPTSSKSGTPSGLYRGIGDVADLAAHGDGAAAGRLSGALLAAEPKFLADAIRSEPNITARKRVLRGISNHASPAATLALAKATALAYDKPLSPVLSALLEKLAGEAENLPADIGIAADHSFRDLFKYIVETWSSNSVDNVSQGYDSLFGDVQNADEKPAGSATPEPERVLALAFETGATGSLVWTAVSHVGETFDGVRRILGMVKRAPAESRAAATIAQQFANPQRLSMLLHEDPVDFDIVDALLARMGAGAAAALLDALGEAKTRETRRGLLDRLIAIGPEVGPLVAGRLKSDARWYVQRNMLMVMREARCSTKDVPLDQYTAHADPRVRREATHLQFNDPVDRDRALAAALRDGDIGMLKIGLKAARTSMPESVVPILARRVVDPSFPPEFRTSALQLIARSNSMLALESLLRYVMGGTTLLGKPKLAAKTPEMLIALAGLARSWQNERRAAPLIALARDSKDPEIANAVKRPDRGDGSE